jgi:DNA polymerase III epsilon subunit-like protein
LKDFNNLLGNHFNQPQHILCGHNAKEFDIPFLARRMIINQIHYLKTESIRQTMGNSASGYAGIMEVWDYKHYTLKLMCKVLGIPS